MGQNSLNEDDLERLGALLASGGWRIFLEHVVKPKVRGLRETALRADNLTEKQHHAIVKQLGCLREIISQTYEKADGKLPESLEQLFR